MRLSRAFSIFLAVFLLGLTYYYYPNLPDRMASHFNAIGEPDGWTAKNAFLFAEAIILCFIGIFIYVLPRFLESIPDSFINLPNKEYWLAPANRAKTFAILKKQFEWLGVALLGLVTGSFLFTFKANSTGGNLSEWTWVILVAFLIFVGFWTYKIITTFKGK